jgi:hypothetical protein
MELVLNGLGFHAKIYASLAKHIIKNINAGNGRDAAAGADTVHTEVEVMEWVETDLDHTGSIRRHDVAGVSEEAWCAMDKYGASRGMKFRFA